jgi:hypothetical protein
LSTSFIKENNVEVCVPPTRRVPASLTLEAQLLAEMTSSEAVEPAATNASYALVSRSVEEEFELDSLPEVLPKEAELELSEDDPQPASPTNANDAPARPRACRRVTLFSKRDMFNVLSHTSFIVGWAPTPASPMATPYPFHK